MKCYLLISKNLRKWFLNFYISIKKKQKGWIFWKCLNPKCHYYITDVEYKSIKFDYGCPKCGTSLNLFSSFQPLNKKR